MKLRINLPEIITKRSRFDRMIEGLLRTVDRVMDRPRRKSVKTTRTEDRELVSKSA